MNNNTTEINIFSSIYVDRLYRNLVASQDYSSYMSDTFPGNHVHAKGNTNIFIDNNFQLDPSKDDLYNAIQIYESLKNINEVQASDERLWAYFTHVLCWDYMRKRWPVDGREQPINRIKDRYFLRSLSLQNLTRNGIARLWWYAHLTYDSKRENKYELTGILLSRADLTVGITERALGTNKNIRVAILEFLKANPVISSNEDKTREALKRLNLFGGVKLLPFLNVTEIKDILTNVTADIAA